LLSTAKYSTVLEIFGSPGLAFDLPSRRSQAEACTSSSAKRRNRPCYATEAE
jgi:hypothetical protein